MQKSFWALHREPFFSVRVRCQGLFTWDCSYLTNLCRQALVRYYFSTKAGSQEPQNKGSRDSTYCAPYLCFQPSCLVLRMLHVCIDLPMHELVRAY